jgi:putative endonuclease
MLECADKSLYTGITNNLDRRMAEHAAGKGAKYTKGRGPFRLVYCEPCQGRAEASKRETAINRWTRGRSFSCFHETDTVVGLRGIDNMDANRIVSAAAQEAASVRELYTQLSQVEFDQRMQTDLRPFFHNESALKALVQTSATHSCASS